MYFVHRIVSRTVFYLRETVNTKNNDNNKKNKIVKVRGREYLLVVVVVLSGLNYLDPTDRIYFFQSPTLSVIIPTPRYFILRLISVS